MSWDWISRTRLGWMMMVVVVVVWTMQTLLEQCREVLGR